MTIADMAIYPWAKGWETQEQTLDDKPHMRRWLDEMRGPPGRAARPGGGRRGAEPAPPWTARRSASSSGRPPQRRRVLIPRGAEDRRAPPDRPGETGKDRLP